MARKSENLNLRIDEKLGFAVDFATRATGKTKQAFAEDGIRANADAAVDVQGRNWRKFWDPSPGVRELSLMRWGAFETTVEEDRRAEFVRAHSTFFFLDDAQETIWRAAVDEAKTRQLYSSVDTLEKHIRLYIVPHFGRSITLGGVSEQDCRAFYEKLLAEHSIAYANNIANTLKSIYTEAIAQGLALKSPAAAVTTKNPDNARKRRITAAEVARLFEAAERLPWRKGEMLLWVLYWTGMRIEEAQQLERAQVDLEHKTFRRIGTKSGAARDVPILPELAPRLRAWLEHGAGERYLFAQERHRKAGPDGKLPPEKAVSNTPVREWWAAMLRQTAKPGENLPAIADLTPHDLRHHFAKILVDRGVEPRIVMRVLGWTSWQMLQRYVLPDEDEVRESVERAIRGPTVVPNFRDVQ